MADSVDRVFSHALNTVNKIRTGSQKPPSSTRLKLYGLYKQSMEGNVEGIMDRPAGKDEASQRAREKWDSWKAQSGLSRTEAKRRYITTLIETMHKYASPTPDARELVSELEFVWDQVKSNVPSSTASSPQQTLAMSGMHSSLPMMEESPTKSKGGPLRVMSPMSESQEDEMEEDEEGNEDDEFVDARDSQIAEPTPRYHHRSPETQGTEQDTYSRKSRRRGTSSSAVSSGRDPKWRNRVESALVKLTAEVAALREQLESRRLFSHTRRYRFTRWLWVTMWGILKLIAVDVILLGLVLIWLRRKKDKRLEGAIRVLLGDAVASVQIVGQKQLRQIQHAVDKRKLIKAR